MRFFMPEWDDKIDPNYDFINDEHSSEHYKDIKSNDCYMWDVFGIEKVPFDGSLVSITTIKRNKRKYKSIEKMGIHAYLGLPKEFPIMGDCGAYSYLKKEYPDYTTSDLLKTYRDLGFDYGVSIDHLVVPATKHDKERRMKITFDNGVEAFEEWKEKYQNDFQLLVAIQGDTISDYMNMYRAYLEHGVEHMAFGGLVRETTLVINRLLDAIIKDLKESTIKPKYLHFFGVARYAIISKFKEIEKLGVEVAFDSASYLRSAWLASPAAEKNYITSGGHGYSAIRIPEILKGARKHSLNQDDITEIGDECLILLRQYERREIPIDTLIPVLTKLINITGNYSNLLPNYIRLLKERPWEKCGCDICKHAGIETTIFRGSNRNKRRGFHNVYTFYQDLKRMR